MWLRKEVLAENAKLRAEVERIKEMECELCEAKFELGGLSPVCNLCWNQMAAERDALRAKVGQLKKQQVSQKFLQKLDSALAERDALKVQIEQMKKNDYTGDYCSVCKLGIREKEARCEDRGTWYHPLCKVAAERDALKLRE